MFVLTDKDSIANQFIAELRDVHIQKDQLRFRKNMERLGEILAYEISKTLSFRKSEIETPLDRSLTNLPSEYPVLATVLRAGLPFHQGFLNYFDRSENTFIGSYRHQEKGGDSFEIKTDYSTSPSLQDKIVILIDPMLATGQSLVEAVGALRKYGAPKHIHIATLISSKDGIRHLEEHLTNFSLWTGAVDGILNEQKYIIPGLGDAGDLAFGKKL
jgi:uracil phosphoribosyltransferase